eukprot:354624-Chlamydomonas_euryale.AAC.5
MHAWTASATAAGSGRSRISRCAQQPPMWRAFSDRPCAWMQMVTDQLPCAWVPHARDPLTELSRYQPVLLTSCSSLPETTCSATHLLLISPKPETKPLSFPSSPLPFPSLIALPHHSQVHAPQHDLHTTATA